MDCKMLKAGEFPQPSTSAKSGAVATTLLMYAFNLGRFVLVLAEVKLSWLVSIHINPNRNAPIRKT